MERVAPPHKLSIYLPCQPSPTNCGRTCDFHIGLISYNGNHKIWMEANDPCPWGIDWEDVLGGTRAFTHLFTKVSQVVVFRCVLTVALIPKLIVSESNSYLWNINTVNPCKNRPRGGGRGVHYWLLSTIAGQGIIIVQYVVETKILCGPSLQDL